VPVRLYKRETFFYKKHFNINSDFQKAEIDGYFFNEKECGYFSSLNGMVSYYRVGEDEFIEANKLAFIVYKKYGNYFSLYTPDGVKIKDIGSFSYPYFSGEYPLFYCIKTNGSGFDLYSINGDKIVNEINYNSMITSISTDRFLNTLVSTIDARTYLYSIQGKLLFQTDSSDSKINFVKRNVINENGDYLAICSGIEPEIIEIYNINSQTRIKLFQTTNNFNRRTFLEFNNNKLYYESKEILSYYDINKKKFGGYKFKGELNEVKFDKQGNILILSSLDNIYYLTMYATNSTIIFYKEFNKKIENINFINDYSFYFRMENFIVTMAKISV